MNEQPKYKIILNADVRSFIKSLPTKAANKVTYNLNIVAGGLIDKELFKKLAGSEIWEFRTLYMGVCYRLLAFWDTAEEALIITTHGFIKKTDKVPEREIAKAEKLRQLYFETKRIKNI